MQNHKIISIDAGSPDYWRARKHAFALIRKAEMMAERLKHAPMYLHGGYDEDGDVIPVENLGPWEAMDAVIRAIETDAMAVNILVAQRRRRIGGHYVQSVIHILDAE